MLTGTGEIKVTTDGKLARTVPTEFVPVPLGSGYASSVVLEDDTIVTMTGAGTCIRWKVD